MIRLKLPILKESFHRITTKIMLSGSSAAKNKINVCDKKKYSSKYVLRACSAAENYQKNPGFQN